MKSPIADREAADRLRDEIALLAAVREANERLLTVYYSPARVGYEAEAVRAWLEAVAAGINEWDADHPCRAIDEREARVRGLRPDLVLREMGAPTLPGLAFG